MEKIHKKLLYAGAMQRHHDKSGTPVWVHPLARQHERSRNTCLTYSGMFFYYNFLSNMQMDFLAAAIPEPLSPHFVAGGLFEGWNEDATEIGLMIAVSIF